MPATSLTFRTMCGQFHFIFTRFMAKRVELKAAMKQGALKLSSPVDGVMAGLLLSLLYFGNLLYLCGDVELNPGPPKTSSSKQTRLTSTGRTLRNNTESTQPEVSPTTQTSEPTLKDVMDLLGSMSTSWNQPCQTTEETQPTTTATPRDVPSTEVPATDDLASLLKNMNCKFDEMRTNLVKLTNVCTGIQEEISNLKHKFFDLKIENEEIKKENSLLKDKIETLEKKTDILENQSKKNNLIFHGIERKKNETKRECEQAVCELLTNKLQISEEVKFDRLHRVSNKPNSPIVACFSVYRQKEMILKARRKLQGTNIFVSADFSLRVREIRKRLVPFLKEAKKTGKKATMVFDHLVIDGNKMFLGQDGLLSENRD